MSFENTLNFLGIHQPVYFPAHETKISPALVKLPKFNSSSSLASSESCQSDDSNKDSLNFETTQSKRKAERRDRYFEVKKKTELCKTFQLGLICPYGNKCSFAHGTQELKEKLLVPMNYKTAKCKQFFTKDCCHFGPRCQFQHKSAGSNQASALPPLSYDTIFESILNSSQYKTNEVCSMGSLGFRRLRVFQEKTFSY